MRKPFYLILVIITIIFSCSKDEEVIMPEIAYDYAGLTVGKYVVYDVDSLTYDDFTSTIDTASYQIKEVVDSRFTDLEGEEAFQIIRYRKDHDTLSWNLIDAWNSKITATNFQKTEENIKFPIVTSTASVSKNQTHVLVNTLDSTVKVAIPEDHKDVLRLKGKGLKFDTSKGTIRGDHHVILKYN